VSDHAIDPVGGVSPVATIFAKSHPPRLVVYKFGCDESALFPTNRPSGTICHRLTDPLPKVRMLPCCSPRVCGLPITRSGQAFLVMPPRGPSLTRPTRIVRCQLLLTFGLLSLRSAKVFRLHAITSEPSDGSLLCFPDAVTETTRGLTMSPIAVGTNVLDNDGSFYRLALQVWYKLMMSIRQFSLLLR